MSVILYSKASYEALAGSAEFQAGCREFHWNPDEFAADIFRLNCNSYCKRYGADLAECEEAENDPTPDYEFTERLRTARLTDLYRLLGRIDYQVCEYDQGDEAMQQIYYHLQWLREAVANKVMDRLDRLEGVEADEPDADPTWNDWRVIGGWAR